MNAISRVAERTKRLLAPREKFLVLEITPDGTNALFLGVDEDRGLVFEKTIPKADLARLLRSPLQRISQKSWEGEYFFKSHRKIIVSADPSLATTMPIPLELSRERARWKEEITLDELENLIAQAMAKIFTQCRSEAAKRLGIDDIHAIMVGAKAEQFRVDGHAVMNPIGFTGKKATFLLELTFTSRDLFENLKQYFNSPDEFFFVESPQAFLLALSRVRRLPLGVLAPNGDRGTSLFIFQNVDGGHPVLYREAVGWSFDQIFRSIEDAFGVTRRTAKDLYHAYRNGELSETAARHFRKTLQPALDALLADVEKAKVAGPVYFDTPYPIPFDAPHRHKGATFDVLPVGELLAELGLKADPGISDDAMRASFRRLAPFLESYFAKDTSEINQKLRRRLHWLS
ncbi:MAG TPA: hypothetical protein VMT81_01445 [Candidatus Paceibacterota bacterium]|nr:hypothetical protein [Candidatus Paceibacterota bacterium]